MPGELYDRYAADKRWGIHRRRHRDPGTWLIQGDTPNVKQKVLLPTVLAGI